jgi:hypothetical protein
VPSISRPRAAAGLDLKARQTAGESYAALERLDADEEPLPSSEAGGTTLSDADTLAMLRANTTAARPTPQPRRDGRAGHIGRCRRGHRGGGNFSPAPAAFQLAHEFAQVQQPLCKSRPG